MSIITVAECPHSYISKWIIREQPFGEHQHIQTREYEMIQLIVYTPDAPVLRGCATFTLFIQIKEGIW